MCRRVEKSLSTSGKGLMNHTVKARSIRKARIMTNNKQPTTANKKQMSINLRYFRKSNVIIATSFLLVNRFAKISQIKKRTFSKKNPLLMILLFFCYSNFPPKKSFYADRIYDRVPYIQLTMLVC